MVKNLTAVQETQVWSLGWEEPLEKEMQPTPVFLPGKSDGQKSLVGYSPWSHKSWHDLATKLPYQYVSVHKIRDSFSGSKMW